MERKCYIIIDNNYFIDKDFWKDHGIDFILDSEYMIWNNPDYDPQTITFIFSNVLFFFFTQNS